ncbi:MAG: TetR/AcrR family transcriptional regulator [Actinomycetaceae bacterium]|nr:TetR/AcrR family transcriptional regulator [Actinomycetaceae bacterium]
MPKITGANLDEHREKTRDALFSALSSLMREYSFDQISIAQIARRAGIGRTAFYNHYEDKESLLVALIFAATENFTKVLASALEEVDDPIQKIRVYIRAQLELKSQYNLGVSLGSAAAHPRSQIRDHAKIVHHIIFRLIETAHQAGKISQPATPQTVRLVLSCLSGTELPIDPVKRAATKASTEAFILRALGAEEADIAYIDPAIEHLKLRFTKVAPAVRPGPGTTPSRCPITGAITYRAAS